MIFTFATLDGENPALKLTACAALEMTVTIPESIEGSPVTTIASGCFGGAYTSVTIPACVTEIEDGAFAPDTVLIYEPGSYAETWAAEHGFTAEERTWTLRYETGCLLTQESINLPAGAEIPLPTLQRDAYEFLGWSLEENGSVLESVVMPAADSVLYAQWDVTNWELASLLQDLEWETSGNNVIVTAYNGTAESLSLPGSINGKPVTAIGTDAFAYNSTLQRVELPAGLTTIGDSAFFSMRSLRSMEIPAGVQSIGVKAFGSCPALMRVILSEGVQTIGAGAFENTALHSITLPSSLTSIDATTLRGCALLEAVEVADGNRFYRSIDGILYDTADGVLVKYPAARESDSYSVSDVWSIGAWAFHGADRLVSVTLPEDLYSLGEGAFYGCAALNAMPTLGSIVTRIPSQCFYGCISMTEAILPDTIKQIGSQAFAKTSLTELLIPDFVTTIGVQAVDSSVLMRGAAGGYAQTWAGENGVSFLPTGSMTIESLSFGAETLTLMRGKRQQTSLAAEPANAALENIRYFSSDDSVAKIDENGLIYALGKGKATLYASAPGDVLARCVIEVTAPPEPESLRLSTETQTLTIGQSVALTVAISPLEAAQSQITWTSSKKNIAWIDESNRLYAIGVGKTVIRATAENGVYAELSISCEGVDATFTVPAMLKQIGDEAFAGIAAEYVILPDGTTSIGNCAFAGSSSLRVIRIPGTVTTLGTDLFSGCGDVLILAPTGSAAETYAKDHALRFAPIE